MRFIPASAGYQPAQWRNHDSKQRVFAASLALLITAFLSLQFMTQTFKRSESEFLNRPFTVLMFRMPLAEHPKVVDQKHTQKSAINNFRLIRASITQAEKENGPSSVISTEITPAQTTEQPVTLLPINRKSIAKAYNDSKSEIQKMAEASGKELNTPLKTKYDRFQSAAEQAVIPDCLAPQGPGGIGLLAIPVIIFEAATGKCK